MTPEAFDNEIRTLSVMVGSWSSDELFAESYLELLEKVRAVNDPGLKHSWASRMKELALRQTQWLANEWLQAKREDESESEFESYWEI